METFLLTLRTRLKADDTPAMRGLLGGPVSPATSSGSKNKRANEWVRGREGGASVSNLHKGPSTNDISTEAEGGSPKSKHQGRLCGLYTTDQPLMRTRHKGEGCQK